MTLYSVGSRQLSLEDVDAMPGGELVALYNELIGPGTQVRKFADKRTALRRVGALLTMQPAVVDAVKVAYIDCEEGKYEASKRSRPVTAGASRRQYDPRTLEEIVLDLAPRKDKKRRGFRFVFPWKDEVKAVKGGTARAKLLELISRPAGATHNELYQETWATDKFRVSKAGELQRSLTLEERVKAWYEAMRLLHFYCGYGMVESEDKPKVVRLRPRQTRR